MYLAQFIVSKYLCLVFFRDKNSYILIKITYVKNVAATQVFTKDSIVTLDLSRYLGCLNLFVVLHCDDSSFDSDDRPVPYPVILNEVHILIF